MAAVGPSFSTLNDLAYGGVLARAWYRPRPGCGRLGARLEGPSPWESRLRPRRRRPARSRSCWTIRWWVW